MRINSKRMNYGADKFKTNKYTHATKKKERDGRQQPRRRRPYESSKQEKNYSLTTYEASLSSVLNSSILRDFSSTRAFRKDAMST